MPAFLPTPDTETALVEAILDPEASFNAIAREFNTSNESLALWVTQPRVLDRLAPINRAAAIRISLIADNHLPTAASALAKVMASFNADQLQDEDLQSRVRAAALAIRAAATLLRLSRQESTERKLGRLASNAPILPIESKAARIQPEPTRSTPQPTLAVIAAAKPEVAKVEPPTEPKPVAAIAPAPVEPTIAPAPSDTADLDQADALLDSIDAELTAAGYPDVEIPRETLEAVVDALQSGDTSTLSDEAAAIYNNINHYLAAHATNSS